MEGSTGQGMENFFLGRGECGEGVGVGEFGEGFGEGAGFVEEEAFDQRDFFPDGWAAEEDAELLKSK